MVKLSPLGKPIYTVQEFTSLCKYICIMRLQNRIARKYLIQALSKQGKSLTYTENIKCSNSEPFGTPNFTCRSSNTWLLVLTDCCLSDRMEDIEKN